MASHMAGRPTDLLFDGFFLRNKPNTAMATPEQRDNINSALIDYQDVIAIHYRKQQLQGMFLQ